MQRKKNRERKEANTQIDRVINKLRQTDKRMECKKTNNRTKKRREEIFKNLKKKQINE